jgi:Curli production assembly/transport component CsgG
MFSGEGEVMKTGVLLATLVICISLAACSTTQLGGGSSPVTGSSGQGGAAQGAATQLVQCTAPIGTIALVESQIPALAQIGLSSPVPLIRLMAAQSRCFYVVERGQALDRMGQERQFAASGLLQQGSNIGTGQMVAADYYITPNVVFSNNDAGGISGAAALIPGYGGMIASALAAGLRFKEAQAVMMVTDTRSGVQVAIAEGRSQAIDMGGGLGVGSISGLGSLAGYGNTSQGKVVAGAFLDSFNKMVEHLQAMPNR